MDNTTDVVVVGAGLGGMAAAIVAADRGLRARLVEKSAKVGGARGWGGPRPRWRAPWSGGCPLDVRRRPLTRRCFQGHSAIYNHN